MEIFRNVDTGPRNGRLYFGHVLDSGGTLTFDLLEIKAEIKGQGAVII